MTAVAVVKIQIDDTEFRNFLRSTRGLKIDLNPRIRPQDEEKERKKRKKRWLEEDRHGKSFIKHLQDATKSLAKWTAITGGLGVAGAYGAGKLGNSIEQQRYSARGLGISTAEQGAFKLNYRSLVDTEAMLSKVAEAMNDYSKQSAFSAIGLNQSDWMGKSAAEVAEIALPLIKKKFEEFPTQQGAEAFKLLDLVGGMADLRRLQSARTEEIEAIQKQNEIDKQQIRLSEQVQQDWVKLSQQATRAGQQIEVEFVKALVKVAPELTKLSDALVVDIRELAGSNGLKDGVHELSKGIHVLSDYLGSESFKGDIKGFTEMIHKVAGYFGLGDQSDTELNEFNKAVASGEVNTDFKEYLSDEDRKKMAHDWYSEKQKKSQFMSINPPSQWGQINENSAIGKGKKFFEEQTNDLKRYMQKQSYSGGRTNISITNNSSADVAYNMNRLGI